MQARQVFPATGRSRSPGSGCRAGACPPAVFSFSPEFVSAEDGEGTLDAAVMEGARRAAGAVAAIRGFAHPVRVARLVLERTPHVLLVGAGAEAFAAAQGQARVPPGYFVSVPDARAPRVYGTVGAVALDADGRLAAATSTGGVVGKLPGRVGDLPLIGAGTYADARCAVSATGTGEHFVRAVFAFRLAVMVEGGSALAAAADAALAEVSALGGAGGCVAVSARGEVALPFTTGAMLRGFADAEKVAVCPPGPSATAGAPGPWRSGRG